MKGYITTSLMAFALSLSGASSAVTKTAAHCAELEALLKASEETIPFASLDERIASGESLGYFAPKADWQMPENRKCGIAAAWQKGNAFYDHGARITCEVYHQPFRGGSFYEARDAALALASSIETCPVLAGWERVDTDPEEYSSGRKEFSNVWTHTETGTQVIALAKETPMRSRSEIEAYLRIQRALPE